MDHRSRVLGMKHIKGVMQCFQIYLAVKAFILFSSEDLGRIQNWRICTSCGEQPTKDICAPERRIYDRERKDKGSMLSENLELFQKGL